MRVCVYVRMFLTLSIEHLDLSSDDCLDYYIATAKYAINVAVVNEPD